MIINKTLVSFAGRAPSPRYVPVGVVGDNLVECVEFRLLTIDADQTATMLLKCKYADAVTLTRTDAGTYCADITAQIAGESGRLEAYIRIDGAGGAVWNSEPFMLCVCNAPDISGDIEDREPGALEQTLSAIAAHNAAMKQHSEDMEEATESASESAENAEKAAERAEAAAERAENAGGSGGSGNPGKDGGYYQPSVTDGVLSWTPSKTDMPAVPASDVRGPAGQDGQPGKDGQDGTPGLPGKTAYQYAQDGGYTGTEAEFATKLAEGVYSKQETDAAISRAVKEGVYEVIGEMVVNEDGINRIELTKDADGNALKLKAVYMWMTMPAHIKESCPVLAGVVSDYVYSTFNSFVTSETETYHYAQFWIANGALNTEYSSAQNTIAGGLNKNRRMYDLLPLSEFNMVYAHTLVGKYLPIGFKVKIWGVRA